MGHPVVKLFYANHQFSRVIFRARYHVFRILFQVRVIEFLLAGKAMLFFSKVDPRDVVADFILTNIIALISR